MISYNKRSFLFKCDQCEMIVSVELDEESDIQEAQDDKIVLECPCGGHGIYLRN